MLFTMILLIGSTFAEKVEIVKAEGDNGGGVWHGKTGGNWDNHKKSVNAYIYMDVLDKKGNPAAYLSVVVNRSYYGKYKRPLHQEIDAVKYSADACVYTAGWDGKAKVRVQVPTPENANEKNIEERIKNIGGAGEPSSVAASISTLRDKGGINVNGNRQVKAFARAWMGGINATIHLKVSEF